MEGGRQPAILYTVIVRNGAPLAEHSTAAGTFVDAAHQVLRVIQETNEKANRLSYHYDSYYFHIQRSEEGLLVLCFCDEKFSKVAAFAFLDHTLEAFLRKFGRETIAQASAFELSTSFSSRLQADMVSYTRDAISIDKTAAMRLKVEGLKEIMAKNIQLVNERGEALQIIVKKAQELAKVAKGFEDGAKAVRWKFFKENIKLWVIMIIFVIAFVWLMLSLACGFTFSYCTPSSTST